MNTEHTSIAIFLIVLSSFIANAIHYKTNPSRLMLLTVVGSSILGIIGAIMLAAALKEDEDNTDKIKAEIQKIAFSKLNLPANSLFSERKLKK